MPERPVISNYATPAKKVSEVLDNHLKPVMQQVMSYIKDSNNFMYKIRDFQDILNDTLFFTADDVGLYPSIPHEVGLQALKEVLDRRKDKKISTNDLLEMAAFVLKNNYF